tara:strand:+ start:3721 stop:3897 length:177 start_codon:yes stop_codon:yes gene_type:complete
MKYKIFKLKMMKSLKLFLDLMIKKNKRKKKRKMIRNQKRNETKNHNYYLRNKSNFIIS